MTASIDELERIVAANGDTAERLLQATGELSAAANKLAPTHSNSAAVTLNGGGILAAVLAVVGVFACVIGIAGLMIAQVQNEKMAESNAQLRHEVEKLSRDVELHGVYITEFRRQTAVNNPQPKKEQ